MALWLQAPVFWLTLRSPPSVWKQGFTFPLKLSLDTDKRTRSRYAEQHLRFNAPNRTQPDAMKFYWVTFAWAPYSGNASCAILSLQLRDSLPSSRQPKWQPTYSKYLPGKVQLSKLNSSVLPANMLRILIGTSSQIWYGYCLKFRQMTIRVDFSCLLTISAYIVECLHLMSFSSPKLALFSFKLA